MTLFLPTLAVAFAAFCVWLTVRIVNRKERWAMWTAGILLVAALTTYPLTTGPVEWMRLNGCLTARQSTMLRQFHGPLVWLAEIGPHQIGDTCESYCDWCIETLDEWSE